jgi:hypothetical protein
VRYIAKPHPVNAQPFSVVMPMNCQYPWCEHKTLTTDGSEMAVRARVLDDHGVSHTGNMHVSHTVLFDRYGDRRLECYEDDKPDDTYDGAYEKPQISRGAGVDVRELIHTMPTDTIFVSNVEDLIKRLDPVGEVLIIQRTSGTAHTRRVNVWRMMP